MSKAASLTEVPQPRNQLSTVRAPDPFAACKRSRVRKRRVLADEMLPKGASERD